MNIWQIAQQVQNLLQNALWPGSSTYVFHPASVLVLAGESDIDALDANLILPMAVIIPQGGQSDPQANDEPGYMVKSLEVIVAVRNSGDRTGQGSVLGANRVGIMDSRGRGALELEIPVKNALRLLNVHDGVTVALKSQSDLTTRRDASDTIYTLQSFTFEVSCTDELFYPPVRRLAGTAGTGQVTLNWDLPSARFDRYRVVVRRASGSTAPTTISSGTGVTVAALATSVVDVVAAGTYSYSVFVTYDDLSRTLNEAAPANDTRVSTAVSKTGLVVA